MRLTPIYGAGFLAGGAESVTLLPSSAATASGFFRLIKWLMSLAFGLAASVVVLDVAASPSEPPPINAPMPAVEISLLRS